LNSISRNKGFHCIALIISLAIIGLIASAAFAPSFMPTQSLCHQEAHRIMDLLSEQRFLSLKHEHRIYLRIADLKNSTQLQLFKKEKNQEEVLDSYTCLSPGCFLRFQHFGEEFYSDPLELVNTNGSIHINLPSAHCWVIINDLGRARIKIHQKTGQDQQ
jgi:Tfp pilus assembly protein PilE